jgi:four helix bundle protein
MPQIKSFRELDVYQSSLEQSRIIFDLTRRFPKEEKYALTSQIRRSSRAVCALLAEAWARRRYEAAFANKVNEALGEAMETQAWLDHSVQCDYITAEQHQALDAEWQRIGGMLMRMEQRSSTFTRGSGGT